MSEQGRHGCASMHAWAEAYLVGEVALRAEMKMRGREQCMYWFGFEAYLGG